MHARRKFHDLWINYQSPLAEEALKLFGALYDVERQARELSAEERQRIRQLQSRPIADKLREWLLLHRLKATDGTAIAKALDYSLGRWQALARFVADGALPIDTDVFDKPFTRILASAAILTSALAARLSTTEAKH